MKHEEFKEKMINFGKTTTSNQLNTIKRMNKHNDLARNVNAIYEIIERETQEFKLKLMSEVLTILERED